MKNGFFFRGEGDVKESGNASERERENFTHAISQSRGGSERKKLENGLNKSEKKKQRAESRLELGKKVSDRGEKKEFPKLIQLLNYFDSFYGSSRFD